MRQGIGIIERNGTRPLDGYAWRVRPDYPEDAPVLRGIALTVTEAKAQMHRAHEEWRRGHMQKGRVDY